MADVAIAIRAYLLTKSAVTDVGGQRIYCDAMPQNATLPAIEMTIVDEVPDMELSDVTGVTKSRVSLNCIAERRSTTRALAKAIRNCGVAAIKGVYSTVDIRGVAILNRFDGVFSPTDGAADRNYTTDLHIEVAYLEA